MKNINTSNIDKKQKIKNLQLENIKLLKVDNEYKISMLGISKYNYKERIILNSNSNIKQTEEQLKEMCTKKDIPYLIIGLKTILPKETIANYNKNLKQGNIQSCLEMIYKLNNSLETKKEIIIPNKERFDLKNIKLLKVGEEYMFSIMGRTEKTRNERVVIKKDILENNLRKKCIEENIPIEEINVIEIMNNNLYLQDSYKNTYDKYLTEKYYKLCFRMLCNLVDELNTPKITKPKRNKNNKTQTTAMTKYIDKKEHLKLDNIKVLKVKDEKMISMIGISKNNCDKRIILNLDMTEEQLKEECLQNSTPIEEEAIKKYIPKDIRDIYKDKLEQGNIQTCLEILYLTDRVLKNKHNNQEKIKTLKINITK